MNNKFVRNRNSLWFRIVSLVIISIYLCLLAYSFVVKRVNKFCVAELNNIPILFCYYLHQYDRFLKKATELKLRYSRQIQCCKELPLAWGMLGPCFDGPECTRGANEWQAHAHSALPLCPAGVTVTEIPASLCNEREREREISRGEAPSPAHSRLKPFNSVACCKLTYISLELCLLLCFVVSLLFARMFTVFLIVR